jgi:16S rRNA (guanine527-N7)-methyltransferase
VEHPAGGAAVSAAWLGARLARPAEALGAGLSPSALALLARYAELVLDWGARFNLTGARSREALADEHLADALALLAHLPAGPFRYVDVGSGAGLPGLVLAILRPDASGVLLEPARKKHAFLAHAIRELALAARIEARPERLAVHLASACPGYDVAISRAVWPLPEWLELALPLVKPGGSVVGFEGAERTRVPAGAVRHPYALVGKQRAIILLARPR